MEGKMLRKLILPSSIAVTGAIGTYLAATSFSENGTEKRKSRFQEFPMTNRDATTYEQLPLNEVYSRYQIKTLDRKNKENILGEGSYAHVIGCTEVKTGKSVALKVVKKAFTKAPDFEREVQALTAARFHPNIVQLLDIIDVPDADSWLLVTELLEGGELFDRILQRGAFSEHAAATLIRKVASALSCLHRLGWAHNDVKPENIVYCTKNVDSEMKLIDFGMARRHPGAPDYPAEQNLVTRDLGTTAYWPPEVLEPKTRFKSDPRAIDAWTLGVLTYILLFGCHPFDRTGDATEETMAKRIASGSNRPESYIDYDCFSPQLVISPAAKTFLKRLLEEDPIKRMTVDEVLMDPWIVEALKTAEEKEAEEAEGAVVSSSETTSRKLRGERDAQAALGAILKMATDSSASRDVFHTLGDAAPYISENTSEAVRYDLVKRHLRTYTGTIYDVGDATDGLYVLAKGRVRIEYQSEDGGHVTVQMVVPGDVFGETAILEGRNTRNARVQAIDGPVEAYFFSRDDVVAVLSGNLELKEKLDDLSARRYRLRAANALVSRLEANPSLGKLLHVKKGEKIFTKGEPAKHIYLVQSGVVKSIVNDETIVSGKDASEGSEENSESGSAASSLERALGSTSTSSKTQRLVIGEWGPGDVFGISALYGSPRFASAVAQTPVQVIEVRREDLESLLQHEPMLRENLSQQFRTFKERSSSIARKYTKKRKSEMMKHQQDVSSNGGTSGGANPQAEDEEESIITLKKGDVLFRQGDSSASGVFFIQEGEVHLVDADGNVRYVNKQGMTFGTESFVRRAPRKFTAIARSDVKLVRAKVRRLDEDDSEETTNKKRR